jgi:3-oxoacyl-[acyl-carrier protein] reductase
MQDALVEMSRHSVTRQLLKRIGIRPPLPLLRSYRPWSDALLGGKRILVNKAGRYAEQLIPGLQAQKATVDHLGSLTELSGEARVPAVATVYQATLFDTTDFREMSRLRDLYNFFRPALHHLGSHHRVVILLAQPDPLGSPEHQAVLSAIEGFARSLAKESGPRGVNVNCIRVEAAPDTLERLAPMVHFFLSDYAAFITGQILECTSLAARRPIPALAGSLAGRRILVTGAAQGIGYAICRRLGEEGAHVYCLDRPENQKALEELAQHIDGEILMMDLGLPDATQQIADRLQTAPPLDGIVHNAGITRDRTLFSMADKQWDQVLNINLEVVVQLTQELLHRGRIADNGRIICMSSISGLSGNFGQTNYSASKAGLIGFVRALSRHLAAQGMTANAVAPGFIETAMTARVPFMVKQFARRMSSLGQGGLPDDVADLICFLASPASQGITGSVIRVCGGNFLGA